MPNEPQLKDTNQKQYFMEHGTPMLMDYVVRELENKVKFLHDLILFLVIQSCYDLSTIKKDFFILVFCYVLI